MTDFEEQTGAAEIIDATQNAVIDAVNSVSELIEKQSQESTFHQEPVVHEAFYLSAEFWVGIAFVVAVLMILKPLLKALRSGLEKRRNKIIDTLKEAEDLHIEAQRLLADYERRFQNAKEEIETLAKRATTELSTYTHEKNNTLEKELLKKQKEAENIIQTTLQEVRQEMRGAVSKQTMEIVYNHIRQYLNDQKRAELIDESIERILEEL